MRTSRFLLCLVLGTLVAGCPAPNVRPVEDLGHPTDAAGEVPSLADAVADTVADADVVADAADTVATDTVATDTVADTADANPGPEEVAVCPNGLVEPPETCDGDCPELCSDGDACTVDSLHGSPDMCDAVCEHLPVTVCKDLDGCCPDGCAPQGDADCGREKPRVAVVLSRTFADVPSLRGRLLRYQEEHPLFRFLEILLDRTPAPIVSMEDRGGEVKRNWLEVRNTLRDLWAGSSRPVGVWLIAETMPMIWRDAGVFELPSSAYKASIYPLVALSGDWYAAYNPQSGGFTEVEGVTRGRGRGDAYPADLWGAALVPVAGFGDVAGQLADFFNRNHQFVQEPPVSRRLLYADTMGPTSRLLPRIDATGVFASSEARFLAPNSCDELSGFSSTYNVLVHRQGPDFVPTGSGGCLSASGDAELAELEDWESRTWFEDQAEFRRIGDDRSYYFNLRIADKSLPPDTLREVFAASLPPLACAAGDCLVHVADTYFTDDAGIPLDGHWGVFPDQQTALQTLYTSSLATGQYLYTNVLTHGAPESHYFGITSTLVHDGGFSALVYELQACSTADIVATDVNIGATYLFFGGAQAVSGYAQPSVLQCIDGECFDFMHFLNARPGALVIDWLFDRNYTMHVYFGNPLLVLP